VDASFSLCFVLASACKLLKCKRDQAKNQVCLAYKTLVLPQKGIQMTHV
jgi:hypothetical protein